MTSTVQVGRFGVTNTALDIR